MADEAAVLAEAANLPIDKRAAHANWKVRSAAYEHIKLKCTSVFDPSDPCLATFVPVFSKASADGNAAALDKALEALEAFLEKASDAAAGRIVGTVCSNIVGKSLGARPSTVAKGVDCLAAFVVVEQAEKVTVRLVHAKCTPQAASARQAVVAMLSCSAADAANTDLSCFANRHACIMLLLTASATTHQAHVAMAYG
eukprot:GHRQ01020900.1.p1 GENE.GHRQ01020900.1~~GHRQ01020900.1.p1  ORF type:complete len:197 (+),score=46.47 GHRQ01020900.1:338-928(+)